MATQKHPCKTIWYSLSLYTTPDATPYPFCMGGDMHSDIPASYPPSCIETSWRRIPLQTTAALCAPFHCVFLMNPSACPTPTVRFASMNRECFLTSSLVRFSFKSVDLGWRERRIGSVPKKRVKLHHLEREWLQCYALSDYIMEKAMRKTELYVFLAQAEWHWNVLCHTLRTARKRGLLPIVRLERVEGVRAPRSGVLLW